MLLEYVGGGDLSVHLRSGGLPLGQLHEYTQQLLEALCYLHGKSVVHKALRVGSLPVLLAYLWLTWICGILVAFLDLW